MGREVRMVPANWEHPKEFNSYSRTMEYRPLIGGSYAEAAREWDEEAAQWARGYKRDYSVYPDVAFVPYDGEPMTFEEWSGDRPDPSDYMPDWSAEERTHFMMYEDTSEGTPISPAFKTAEELAHWLADTGASSFGNDTATYDQWLAMIKRGFAVSAVVVDGHMMSGVAYD